MPAAAPVTRATLFFEQGHDFAFSHGGASREARPWSILVIIPHFRFEQLLDNPLMASDAFIHEGFNVIKTLRRSTPNG
jgi:hypothetical protein